MSRLTITLSEARYRAIKEATAQDDKTTGQLIDVSLGFYRTQSPEAARHLVRRVRARGKLSEVQAVNMAREEVLAVRCKS